MMTYHSSNSIRLKKQLKYLLEKQMTPAPSYSLDSLDLAALISSRICHDVISPVGAIVNGLEVLQDDRDPAMHEFAMDLIKKSAIAASSRLQFCRLAFGAAGSAGSSIDTRDAQKVAAAFVDDERTKLEWHIPPAYLPKNKVKLLLNLIVIAQATITRGGAISATQTGGELDTVFKITTQGRNIRIPPHALELLEGHVPPEQTAIDAHSIQPYYAGLLARAAGMKVTIELHQDHVLISAF
jgi:histidine phosphotransferase ChpT